MHCLLASYPLWCIWDESHQIQEAELKQRILKLATVIIHTSCIHTYFNTEINMIS